MTLLTFCNTNPWFNACFKFLMCITYSCLLCKLATSFSTFPIFILSGKNGKSYWQLFHFRQYWINLKIFITILIVVFCEIFIKFGFIFNFWMYYHMQVFFWHYWFMEIMYIPLLKIHWFFIFIIIFHRFIISFCISMNSMTYSISNTFFYH